MPVKIEFFVEGAPPSPNNRAATTRGRMISSKGQRERAYVTAVIYRNEHGVTPIRGPAQIQFTVHRAVLLDHDNLAASLKHYQDGVCLALLPFGDGPRTPYTWLPPTQQLVPKGRDGVWVKIETPDA